MPTELDKLIAEHDDLESRLTDVATAIKVLKARGAASAYDAPVSRKTEPAAAVARGSIGTIHSDEGNGAGAPRRRRGRPRRAIRAEPSVTAPRDAKAHGQTAERVLAAVDEAGTITRKDLYARLPDIRPNHIGRAIAGHVRAKRVLDAGDTVHSSTA